MKSQSKKINLVLFLFISIVGGSLRLHCMETLPQELTREIASLLMASILGYDYAFFKKIELDDGIYSLAFNPKGKTIIAGSGNRALLLDRTTGKVVQEFKDTTPIFSVAFSPDGETVLTSSNKAARLWNVRTGKPIQTFTGHTKIILSAAFNPKGGTILTGSSDGTAKIWDIQSGAVLKTLEQKDIHLISSVSSTAWSPNGSLLALGYEDGTVRLYSALSGDPINREFKKHSSRVDLITFSPDGTKITAKYLEGSTMWDIGSGGELKIPGDKKNSVVNILAFSHNGNLLAIGYVDGVIRLYDMLSGNLLNEFKGNAGVRSLVFSQDGKMLASGSLNKTIMLWKRVSNPSQWVKQKELAKNLGIEKELHKLLTPTAQRKIEKFFPSSATSHLMKPTVESAPQRTFTPFKKIPLKYEIYSLAFNREGKTILAGSGNRALLLDRTTGQIIQKFKGHKWPIYSVAFSPSGETILTGSLDKTARLWDIITGRVLQKFIGHEGPVQSVAFNPQGGTILTGSSDGTARIWDIQSGTELKTLGQKDGNMIFSVAWSPNGNVIATGSSDRTVRLYDALSGALLNEFKGNSTASSVAFSPDGGAIVAAGFSEGLKLWDSQSGKELALLGPNTAVKSLVFSSDGSKIVTLSARGEIRLYDVLSEKLLEQLDDTNQEMSSLALGPDGGIIAVGSRSPSKSITLWKQIST